VKDQKVNLRKRDEEKEIGKFSIEEILKMFGELKPPKSKKRIEL
jgi:hypothetical protein